ncbi:MAG: peptidylprolyl isomerase [Pyrinomonadaceae bacterium]
MKRLIFIVCTVFFCFAQTAFAQIPTVTLVRIVKAEDERRWDATLENLLKNKDAKIRTRAALAAGRIGDERAVPALAAMLETDEAIEVRVMVAFALGEIESARGADAILSSMRDEKNYLIFARTIEAAGKIAAANPKDEKSNALRTEILTALEDESVPANPDRTLVLLALTAVLRTKPDGAEAVVAKFLSSSDARIRADALNTLARLRFKNANDRSRELLAKDSDPIVRAGAARMLGVGEDKSAIDLLLNAATKDADLRVRVSAIRSLANLKDAKAADALLERAENLLASYKKSKFAEPIEKNELLEIAAALGRLLANTDNKKAVELLDEFRQADKYKSPETEIALARIAPKIYLDSFTAEYEDIFNGNWRAASAAFQGAAEIANLESSKENDTQKSRTRILLIQLIGAWAVLPAENKNAGQTKLAVPDLLSAFAAFKSENTSNIFHPLLETEEGVQIRTTIAGILADQPVSKENIEALKKAFDIAILYDKTYNDAQLAILDALYKLDKKASVGTFLTALDAPDYLVRKKAFEILKDKDLQRDFPGIQTSLKNALAKKKNQVLPYNPASGTKLGQILNYNADYIRAVSRKNGTVKAILTTTKGSFTIEFFPEEAPLTVDNFIKLARANYFNGLEVHRVVPNFVVQDGDPRGDGNGGPGWEIRDEINMIPYNRGAVGMALSGKDTGGSQWFVTHSPQPHLDGGYTVFGQVNETDMEIVDNIVRRDKILSVKIVEDISRKGTNNAKKK